MADYPQARAMQEQMAREIEAEAPRYLVYVDDASSWKMTRRSSRLIFDWFGNYQNLFEIVGWSEAHRDGSVLHWEVPTQWPPQAPGWMAIYRRTGGDPLRR